MIKSTLFIVACLACFALPFAPGNTDSHWDYSKNGSVSEQHAGNAGNFRSFHCTTDDSAEAVVLWYANQLGLPEDHSLVIKSRKGFSKLQNVTVIKTGYGHDTDKRMDHTTMLAILSPEHVHITFLHRPDFVENRDVTISITSAPNGKTGITVIQPVIGDFRQNVEQ